MKNKRGSHVGMILSFVIFVTFLVFLYSILQPSIKVKQDKENLLKNLKTELTEKFSADIGVITFVINITTNEECVNLEGMVSQLPNSHIVIKNESSDVVTAVIDGGDSNNLLLDRSGTGNNFFKIYHSDEFAGLVTDEINPCDDVSEDKYVFKSIDTGEEIFYSKINETKEEYEADYVQLKDELNIPGGSEFSFIFKGEDGSVIATDEKNVSTSVYAEQVPILYVDNEANIKSGFLIIRVW